MAVEPDFLAALAPLPILHSGLTPFEKMRLVDAMLTLTARVAAGQTEQLHLDTACDIEDISEPEILRVHAASFSPYLNCSISLATALTGIRNANTSDLARRRRTTVARAALDRLTGADRTQLLAYLGGDDCISIEDIIDVIRTSGALAHCATLVRNLFTKARRNIVDAPHLPPELQNALAVIWQYMFDLYDPDSEISRLYLQQDRVSRCRQTRTLDHYRQWIEAIIGSSKASSPSKRAAGASSPGSTPTSPPGSSPRPRPSGTTGASTHPSDAPYHNH